MLSFQKRISKDNLLKDGGKNAERVRVRACMCVCVRARAFVRV